MELSSWGFDGEWNRRRETTKNGVWEEEKVMERLRFCWMDSPLKVRGGKRSCKRH